MRQFNPTMKAIALSVDAEKDALRRSRWAENRKKARTDTKLYRLYSDNVPCSRVVACHPMEAGAWNRNAAAYYALQASLDRVNLPLLEWKEENDPAKAMLWDVVYSDGGKRDTIRVCAETKAEARREFTNLARPTWIIVTIDLSETPE